MCVINISDVQKVFITIFINYLVAKYLIEVRNRNKFKTFKVYVFLVPTVGEKNIATTKIRNNYVAIQ